MNLLKLGKYKFEILPGFREDSALPDGSFYVVIRDQIGYILSSTSLTHRFSDPEEATSFCVQVANSSIKIQDLVAEEQKAFDARQKNQMEAATQEFHHFMKEIQGIGVNEQQLQQLMAAYDKLPAEARGMIRDPDCVKNFVAENPMPEKKKTITFGEWMEASKYDVDVCLVDSDTGEHALDAVCYLTAEDKRAGLEYSPLEEWLFSLPVERIINEGYNAQLLTVKTEYTMEQTDFLLGYSLDGFDDMEMWALYKRADLADADFNARLNYLKDGTPFETPFDGACMDAASPSDRKELCAFLTTHPNALITPAQGDGLFVVYSVEFNGKGGMHNEDCMVCVKMTEPGKGLTSTIDGKVFYAQQKAQQASDHNQPVITPEKTV